MNKISTFIIVVVLLARLGIYIYEKNKSKIDNLVAQAVPVTTKENINERTSQYPTETPAKVVSTYTMTFLLTGNNEIYYYVGDFNGSLNTIDYNTLGIFIKAYKNAVNPDDLMFIIKADKKSTFKNVIDVLDEMTKNEVPVGHYAEQEITKEETDRIKLLKETKNG